MDSISFLIFLLWLAGSVLVVRFVRRTGGTKIGKVAHWFGGACVMIGFAVVLVFIYANLSPTFGGKLNTYFVTHLVKDRSSLSGQGQPEYVLVPLTVQTQAGTSIVNQFRSPGRPVTVFRPGVVNTEATISGDRLNLNPSRDIRTSLWWMLWSSDRIKTDR